jgi:hypothetical protein
MAERRKIRSRETQLAFEALAIEGGLLSADWLARVAQQAAGGQSDADYRVPKGIQLRDDIGRYWRIAQAYWGDLTKGRAAGGDPRALAEAFVHGLLRECLGFVSLEKTEPIVLHDRMYPVGGMALGGRVPVVIAPAAFGLDTPSGAFGDGTRKRSAFGLAQEFLNASDDAMWGIASDALTLRILRDNASLTRPAWMEADLGRIFTEERFADFAALWLLAHETRFGAKDRPAADCALEAWRSAGREEGTRAREQLREGVEDALLTLGSGFLANNENGTIRVALESGALTKEAFFQEVLRLVYRIIFLLTAEERSVLHDPTATEGAKKLYAEGYGMRRLRDRSARRNAYDRFGDLWEAFKIVLRGLSRGEARFGLPALGGLFDLSQCPTLDAAKLENRALLFAVFRLSWLREDGSLARVNWRDMGPEELGSVYESLLELVPQIADGGRALSFATGAETKGNARKTTGSYYTPDSLVQVLLDSALEPVADATIAKHPDKPVAALLGLTIVDPACGSGHFLLSAARRLAARIARIESTGTPSAEQYRHALRRVVGHCLFGVDLNAMAVELCKVALWMEAVEPGRPLSFLDSHIQHGNSVLGTTPELMANGIPDAAWEPIEGDDKKIANALKKQNRQETKELSLDFSRPPVSTYARLGEGARAVDDEDDATLGSIETKAKHWSDLTKSAAFQHQRFVADTWCAAFVWKKEAGRLRDAAPTNGVFTRLQRDASRVDPTLREEVEHLREQYAWFHWPLRFPQVFATGGFDVVLGNPPWDEYRPEEKAFFRAVAPEVAAIENRAQRHLEMERVAGLSPDVRTAWDHYRRAFAAGSRYIHACGRFELSSKGNLSTAVLFTDAARSLLRADGRAGLVIPSGLATNQGTAPLFSALLNTGTLLSLYDFENRERLFDAVDGRMRFSLVTLSGEGVPGRKGEFGFSFHSPAEIRDGSRTFALDAGDVLAVNPESGTCPVFRTRRDAGIVMSIHRSFPILSRDESGWKASTASLFQMSHEASLLVDAPYGLTSPVPLLEGKMLQQFDHRAADIVINLANADRQGQPKELSEAAHSDPTRAPAPRYWVERRHLLAKVAGRWEHPWFLHFCAVTSATNERTCIAAISPFYGAGHSLFQIYPTSANAAEACCLLANLNSFAFDFVLRQKLGGINLSHFIMRQLPVIERARFARRSAAALDSWHQWLATRVLELTYTAWDLEPFARDVGYDGPPFRWDPARRFFLRCELDAAFFHLYGVSREDTDYVLDTFPIARKNDEKAHGEYRTKRVILEIYDAIVEATRTAQPYATRLDPPPADPCVAHPPRARSGSPS